MAELSYTLTGGVNVLVTISETLHGTLTVQLDVLDETGSIGDLNGFFFDLADDSITETLSIAGDDVTGTALKVDGVTKVDGYNNVNGDVVKELGKFDGGVQFGTSGMAADDIRSTSFTISSSEGPLTLTDLALQDIAVRLTSVGAEDGSRGDSLKIGGSLPDAPEEPVAPVVVAQDDYITVYESEGSGDIDAFIFANDTSDGAVYDGTLHDAEGNPILDPVVMTDPFTGATLTIYPDGSADFSAEGQFGYLGPEEPALPIVFSYEIAGGATANVFVTVLGEGDPTGPGGPGGPISDAPS